MVCYTCVKDLTFHCDNFKTLSVKRFCTNKVERQYHYFLLLIKLLNSNAGIYTKEIFELLKLCPQEFIPQGSNNRIVLHLFCILLLAQRRINISISFFHGLLNNQIDRCEILQRNNFRVSNRTRCEKAFHVAVGKNNIMLKSHWMHIHNKN